ncbi:MAG: radical SAM protein [Planctomycetes bacterium]|nr:radical SAM protein [Planctomycetota bacterium]
MMKNLKLSECKNRTGYSFRWAITNKCEGECKHCNRAGRYFKKDISYNYCLEILASFRTFLLKNNLIGQITFTGGDPLQRKDFFDILEVAYEYKKSGIIDRIGVAGTPLKITPKIAVKLKEFDISFFSLSLDGMEKTHDDIRKRGDFRQTLLALRHLKKAGIKTKINFTLSRINSDELEDCISLLVDKQVNIFTFGLLWPGGKGAELRSKMLTPLEYRDVLIRLINLFDKLPGDCNFKYEIIAPQEYHHLFARAYYELGRLDEYKKIITHKNYRSSAVEKPILKINEITKGKTINPLFFQKHYESWKKTEPAKKNADKFKKCSLCPVKQYCRNTVREKHNPDITMNRMCWVE